MKQLIKIFDKYVGAKFSKDEDGKEYTHYSLNKDDTVISEIKKLNGSNFVRVWFPNTVGTMDLRQDRLNIRIKKIGNDFQITRVYFG